MSDRGSYDPAPALSVRLQPSHELDRIEAAVPCVTCDLDEGYGPPCGTTACRDHIIGWVAADVKAERGEAVINAHLATLREREQDIAELVEAAGEQVRSIDACLLAPQVPYSVAKARDRLKAALRNVSG